MSRSARGVSVLPPETLLVDRARDFLALGPADAAALVGRICQLPGAPAAVAEHMAQALLGSHPDFARDAAGRWWLAAQLAAATPRVAPAGPRAADTPLASLSYAVVDVETTGTSPERGDRITEIAIVLVRGGEIVSSYSELVNPLRPVPRFITGLTGITNEMVRDKLPFHQHCAEVTARLEGHVFVAHNVSFDWRFVSAEVARSSGQRLDGRRLCTVRLARRLLPQLRRRSLDHVCHHYGIETFDDSDRARHRALGDAEATARVLVRLLGEAADHGCTTWGELESFLATPASTGRRRRRPPGMPGWAHGGEGA